MKYKTKEIQFINKQRRRMENSITQFLCDRQIDLLTDKVIHRKAPLLLIVKKMDFKGATAPKNVFEAIPRDPPPRPSSWTSASGSAE